MPLRYTRYDIDLDVIAHNFRQVKRMLSTDENGKPVEKLPATAVVLKADAYALGAIPVAGVLIREGADMLAVACLSEALALRKAYSDMPILIMGHTPSSYLELAIKNNITCTIFNIEQAKTISDAAIKNNVKAKVHIKVDSGMNRLGIKPEQFPEGGAATLIKNIADLPGIIIEGIFSHLALCDEKEDIKQFAIFKKLVDEVEALGIKIKYKHICDSIGLMRYPEYRMDMVRPGAVMYGVCPMGTPLSKSADIRTPFCFSTRIVRLRHLEEGEGVGYDYLWRAPKGGAKIATLPVGYADGFKRCMSNNGYVSVNGQRAKVVGLVCMDQCTIDVTGLKNVKEGDEVILLGGDSKEKPGFGIPILEASNWAHENRNDLICDIKKRVPRVYWENKKVVKEIDDILGGDFYD